MIFMLLHPYSISHMLLGEYKLARDRSMYVDLYQMYLKKILPVPPHIREGGTSGECLLTTS